MKSTRTLCGALLLVLTLSLLFCPSSIAQGPANVSAESSVNSAPPPDAPSQTAAGSADDSWHFTLAPYLWFPGVHGTVGALGHEASIHVSGADVLSNFNFGLMGYVEARKDRLVFPVDFMWVRLKDDTGIPENDFNQSSIKVTLTQLMLTPKFGYRVIDTEHWKTDILAGIRYWHIGQTLTLEPSGLGVSPSLNWVDGLFGSKITWDFNEKAGITVAGDVGGGGASLDYQAVGYFGYRVKPNINLLLGWRYLYVNYSDHTAIYNVAQSGPALGVTFDFGGRPPAPPVATCSVSPTEIWSGDPVTATMSTQYFNPKHTLTYSWTSNGGKISGTGTTGNIDTTGLAPGTYSVTGTATDPKEKKNNVASCNASFTVKQPHPPTATCSASPDTVKAGDPSTVTVNASSPDGFPLTYAWTANAGHISGTGTSATLDTAGAPQGSPITATATVTDSRNLSTTCVATVNVLAAPVAVSEVSEVGECQFNDAKRPWRVDNTCKAVLDDVALRIQREPNGKFVVVGYTDEDEKIKMTQLGAQRAVNVKYYLTEGEGKSGIDPSRIEPRTGVAASKSVKIYFVPSGASFTEESTVVDETQIKGQSRNAPAPKKKAKKTSASQMPPAQ